MRPERVKRGGGGRQRGEAEARTFAGKQQLRDAPPARRAMRTARRTQVASPRASPSSPGRRSRAPLPPRTFPRSSAARATLVEEESRCSARIESNQIKSTRLQQLLRGCNKSQTMCAHTHTHTHTHSRVCACSSCK